MHFKICADRQVGVKLHEFRNKTVLYSMLVARVAAERAVEGGDGAAR